MREHYECQVHNKSKPSQKSPRNKIMILYIAHTSEKSKKRVIGLTKI
jgi:hypothetical protein